MKVKKICQYCGIEYYVSKSQEERSKFCSNKCFRASKNKQIEYLCDYCGSSFMVTQSQVEKVKNGEKKGLYCCAQCAKDVQKPKWNDIVALFESYDYELVSTEYVNAKTKLQYICNKHRDKGIQSIRYENLRHGYGCKYCGDERTADARRLSFNEAKEIFARHDMELLEQPYINTSVPMAYICKHHPEVGVQYMCTSNAYKQHCPYCHVSKGEHQISQYLRNNSILFKEHKTFDDLLGVGGGKLSYDFYLPEYNLLIEYQGEQHECPVEHFGGEEQFKIQQEHDKRKRNYAQSRNIELLEIWYYDFSCIENILNNYLKQIA